MGGKPDKNKEETMQSELSGVISFSRLLWQLSIFLFGFLLLIATHFTFTALVDDMNQRTANEQSRLMIGEVIIHTIQAIESGVYKMATTVGVKGQSVIHRGIDEQMLILSDALQVLTQGGTIKKQIRLNIAGHDRMIREIHYQPEFGNRGYVLEAIDLAPKVNEIRDKINRLALMLAQREAARETGDKEARLEAVNRIKSMLRIYDPLFVRLKENANRLFFDSHQHMEELKTAVAEQQAGYYWIEGTLAFLIIMLVMVFGLFFARQISRSNGLLSKAHDDMLSAKLDSENANKSKSQFLSNMSHELRTPLNAILGYTQILQLEKSLSETQLKSLREIEMAADHQLTLINEVLDLAKVESGHIELSMEPLLVDTLVEEVCSLVKSMAEAKKIHLNYVSDIPGAAVHCDLVRLRQVLLNLLSNGIKYNREYGSLHVRSTSSSEPDRLRITISDTGHGIDPAYKSKLFKPFSRLTKDVGTIQGTGIGLVLTKQLVEAMGGDIGFDSKMGIGSSFWVEFDVYHGKLPENAVAAKHETAAEIAPRQTGGDSKLLLLEDNPVNQALIEQQLNILGYVADIAANGEEGLQLYEQNRYALILTDCNMPVMDGYEFTEAVRRKEQPGPRRLPIIAITANAMQDETVRCFQSGMDDHLAKPISLNVLKDTLEKWLEPEPAAITSAVDSIIDKQEVDTITVEEAPIIPGVLEEMVGDNPVVHQQLIRSFLNTAKSGVYTLLRAFDLRHEDEIAFQAHKLKSSAKAVGAYILSDICQTLENAAKIPDWDGIAPVVAQAKEQLAKIEKHLDSNLSPVVEDSGIISEKQDAGSQTLRCMVVDDDPFMLDHLSMLLNNASIDNIITAGSGDEALYLLRAVKDAINLIICDLNMPGMDGITFLRYAAESGYQGDIIPVSGEDQRVLKTAAELAKAHKLNVIGALEKPVDAEALNRLLLGVGRHKKVVEFTPKDTSKISPELLAEAIRDDTLSVYFQPKVSVTTREVVAVEALARWEHPDLGFVSPGVFIPLAEEHGLIEELTTLISINAINQASQWHSAGMDIKVAINFSTKSFNRLDLPEWLSSVAREAGLEPDRVIVEVTESGLVENMTDALEILSRIRLKGFHLSIDDFGTGYSTLNQLQKIPFSEFKVDRSFVHGATHDPAALAIFEASTDMARKMGLSVVAEGVENIEDWQLAERFGCDQVQGFFIAKPMPADQFDEWLELWREKTSRVLVDTH
jgi:EAL domain-containing protein (putative c-di-GMP-specific phosphodiesterase class I)/signal transduction histidine kinase/HPt (histidine-containing phosphotransfer) domain-containing protein